VSGGAEDGSKRSGSRRSHGSKAEAAAAGAPELAAAHASMRSTSERGGSTRELWTHAAAETAVHSSAAAGPSAGSGGFHGFGGVRGGAATGPGRSASGSRNAPASAPAFVHPAFCLQVAMACRLQGQCYRPQARDGCAVSIAKASHAHLKLAGMGAFRYLIGIRQACTLATTSLGLESICICDWLQSIDHAI
jgi:hypothetical protein